MANKVTGIMLAAANMAAEQVYHDIRSRVRWPYKAPAPEYGLDIAMIYKEAREAYQRTLIKDVIALAATVIALRSVIIAFAALVIIQLVFRRSMRERVREVVTKSADEVEPAGADERCRVLVSGGYAPFIGSGGVFTSWSFTIDLNKPANAGVPVQAAHVPHLYAETQTAIEKLQLPHLQFRDVLCVDGRDVGELADMLPRGRHSVPVAQVPPAFIGRLMGSNDPRRRHYKHLEIKLWSGQMVISVFYRYMKQADVLYTEVKYHVLTPLKQQFLDAERLPFEQNLLLEFGRCVIVAPFLSLFALRDLYRSLEDAIRDLIASPERANRKAIDADRKFNYGWDKSLREQWSGGVYERYFQQADVDFYLKSIKDAFLEGVLGSLKARNISTAAFEQASSIIYNEGIIVSGGTLQAESLAAGKGARATVEKMLQSARPGSTVNAGRTAPA